MTTLNINLWMAANRAGGDAGIGIRGRVTMAGSNYVVANQNIGTSAEDISMGDVAGANALMVLRNVDATNFIYLYGDGSTGTKLIGDLRHGQFAVLFGNDVTLGAKADTDACVLEKAIFETVQLSAGGLVRYTPTRPAIGMCVAGLDLSGMIDGQGIVLAHRYTEAIDGVGILDPIQVTTLAEASWPTTEGPKGGDAFGTIFMLNMGTHAVNDPITLWTAAGSGTFGALPALGGFALIPLNRAGHPYTNAGNTHNEARLITRKTLPA